MYIRILTIFGENVKIVGASMSFVHAIGRKGVPTGATNRMVSRSNASMGADTAMITGMAVTMAGTVVELGSPGR
jgi:hypothetical protein